MNSLDRQVLIKDIKSTNGQCGTNAEDLVALVDWIDALESMVRGSERAYEEHRADSRESHEQKDRRIERLTKNVEFWRQQAKRTEAEIEQQAQEIIETQEQGARALAEYAQEIERLNAIIDGWEAAGFERMEAALTVAVQAVNELITSLNQITNRWLKEADHHLKDCSCLLCVAMRRGNELAHDALARIDQLQGDR